MNKWKLIIFLFFLFTNVLKFDSNFNCNYLKLSKIYQFWNYLSYQNIYFWVCIVLICKLHVNIIYTNKNVSGKFLQHSNDLDLRKSTILSRLQNYWNLEENYFNSICNNNMTLFFGSMKLVAGPTFCTCMQILKIQAQIPRTQFFIGSIVHTM